MCQRGYGKTEDIDTLLNNKPLSKGCCVCLPKAAGCRRVMKVNMANQLNCGIMIRISLEPRNIGGCVSYYQELPTMHVGPKYIVRLRGYDPCAIDGNYRVITLFSLW